MRTLHPLAIGVLSIGVYELQPERTRRRVELMARAHSEGYAVLEAFEVIGNSARDDAVYARIAELAAEVGARALFANGAKVNRYRVGAIAQETSALVIWL